MEQIETNIVEPAADDYYDEATDEDVPPDLPPPVTVTATAPHPADLAKPALMPLPESVQIAVLRTAAAHGITPDDPAWLLLESAQIAIGALQQMQTVSDTVSETISKLPADVASAGQRLSNEASAAVEHAMLEASKKAVIAIGTTMGAVTDSVRNTINVGVESINSKVGNVGSALEGAVKQRRDEIIAEWSDAALSAARKAVRDSGTFKLAASYFAIIGTLMLAGFIGAGLMYFAAAYTGHILPAGVYEQTLPGHAGSILMVPSRSGRADAYCRGTTKICIAVPYKHMWYN
jgi:hypothetical protein